MVQGSCGSVLAAGEGINVIEPSAPPKESPEESGGGNSKLSDGRETAPYDPNVLVRDVLNDSCPYEPNVSAPNGGRRSESEPAGQKEPSFVPNANDDGARKSCSGDGVVSLDDVRSSSTSACSRMSFRDSERESVEDKSFREELGPATGEPRACEGDREVGGDREEGSSGTGGGADSERCVGGGIDGIW